MFDFRQILQISIKQKVWEYLQGYCWPHLFKGWITLSIGLISIYWITSLGGTYQKGARLRDLFSTTTKVVLVS